MLRQASPPERTDVDGLSSVYSYLDDLDRLTQIRRAAGAGSSLESQTNFSYPDPKTVITSKDKETTGDGGLKTQVRYDGLGRQIETDVFESSSQFIATTTSYDAVGRIGTVSNPYRPGDTVYNTSYTYDALNRPIQVQPPDVSNTTTSYSGNWTTVTDPAGKIRQSAMDALGRLVQVLEDPNGLKYTTAYTYDALDDLLSVNQSGQTRSFAYDSLKRLTQATNPESGTTTYSYDNAGNLAKKTDARGIATTYAYDALNRTTGKTYSDGTEAVAYTYDNNPAVPYSVGRLTQESNGWSTTNILGYDPLGRVTAGQQITDGQTYNFSYTYNLAGGLTSESYPSGRVVTTGFDTVNRTSQVSGSLGTQITNYVGSVSYTAHGEPGGFVYGNNLARVFQYNPRLQISSGWDAVGNSSNALLFVLYPNWGTTNNNGDLIGAQTYAGGPGPQQSLTLFIDAYAYDGVNRLTTANDSGYSRSFGYDPYGNVWTSASLGVPLNGMTPTSNVFNPVNNRISGGTYAAAGNQTVVGSYSLAYDAENHQTVAYDNVTQGQANYIYDGDGHRVQKAIIGGSTTTYVYDIEGKLVAEYSTAAPPTSPCYTCYLSYDHLGSARLITDQNAAVVARHDYLPFGEEIPAGSAGRSSQWDVSDNINQKFTGKERDSETGLDYFGARYYGSALSRFTSPDPGPHVSQDPQTWNRYTYVRNNPLKLVDPNGEYFAVNGADTAARLKQYISMLLRSDAGRAVVKGIAADARPTMIFSARLPIQANGNGTLSITGGTTRPTPGSPGTVGGTEVTLDPINGAIIGALSQEKSAFNGQLDAFTHELFHVTDVNAAGSFVQAAAANASGTLL